MPMRWPDLAVRGTGSLWMMLMRTVLQGRRALMLAVVVTGLLVGLVGMHHLSVAPQDTYATMAPTQMVDAGMPSDPAAPPPHDGGGHDSGLLHLCLAVLTAVAVLIVSAVLWRRPRAVATVRRVGTSVPRTAPRAPPPTAPARLALLCVLRT